MTLSATTGPVPLPGTAPSDYQPPADLSGGMIVMGVSNGSSTHRMRFHINPFSPTLVGPTTVAAVSITGHFGIDAAVIPFDYNYSSPRSAATGESQETTVGTTMWVLSAFLSNFYDNTWQITPEKLYQRVPDPLYVAPPGAPVPGHLYPYRLQLVVPTPNPGSYVGRGSQASTTRASQISFNFLTQAPPPVGGVAQNPGRARCVLMESGFWDHSGAVKNVAGAVLTTDEFIALVGYLGGVSDFVTNIVGHNGQPLQPTARVTNSLNHRLRRKADQT